MRIAIGFDHGGFRLGSFLKEKLKKQGYELKDYGCYSEESCDYPDFGVQVAQAVAGGNFDRGVLVCKSGLGMSIVANKIKGIRAALCRDLESIVSSRKHNDANILVLGANFVDNDRAWKWVEKWLNTDFEGGRHARRVDKIRKIEENTFGDHESK